MKIRTDFVTNSSSSSFFIIISIETKDGCKYAFGEPPYECIVDDNDIIDFDTEFKRLFRGKKSKYSNVEEIAKFLMDFIQDGFDEFEDEEYDFKDMDVDDFDIPIFSEETKKQKEDFIQKVSENILSVNDISKIKVCHEYRAWGEYADLIADNDQILCEFAKKVTHTSGEEQKKVLEEMLTYIYTPNGKQRQGEEFGIGYDDIRYAWNGDEEKLIALAKRLCSFYAPEQVEGREVQELDFEDGSVEKYAEFALC